MKKLNNFCCPDFKLLMSIISVVLFYPIAGNGNAKINALRAVIFTSKAG